jgi:hypothetical protein
VVKKYIPAVGSRQLAVASEAIGGKSRWLLAKSQKLFNIAFTFVLVMFTWVFFRAHGLSNAKIVIRKITEFQFSDSIATPFSFNEMLFCWVLIFVLMLKDKYARIISTENTPLFYARFIGLLTLCYFLGIFTSNQFIYFQF